MQIEYNRNGGSNYMVMEGQQVLLPYEEKMLSENSIPALLDFHIVRVNANYRYWYDITGKKSVRGIAESEGLSVGNVTQIIEAVGAAYRMLSQYLVTEDRIYVTEETVFLKNSGSGMEASLCFFPRTEVTQGCPLLGLMEYFISVVDHEKEGVTRLCYTLYEEAVKEGATIADLLRITEEYKEAAGGNPIFERKPENEENARLDETVAGSEPETGKERGRGIFRKKETEDFWMEVPSDITMEEVFADGEEEDEDLSIIGRIGMFFKNIPSRIFGGFRKKKEEIFPPKDLEEDLIYDPKADYSEPTVLLTADKDSCFGKLIYEGNEKEADYMIETDEFHIGSSKKGNEAVLRSPVVSHHHARIIRQEDKYYLEDLNSTNGTFLNGEAITLGQKYELKYMDRVHFANVPYRIV